MYYIWDREHRAISSSAVGDTERDTIITDDTEEKREREREREREKQRERESGTRTACACCERKPEGKMSRRRGGEAKSAAAKDYKRLNPDDGSYIRSGGMQIELRWFIDAVCPWVYCKCG